MLIRTRILSQNNLVLISVDRKRGPDHADGDMDSEIHQETKRAKSTEERPSSEQREILQNVCARIKQNDRPIQAADIKEQLSRISKAAQNKESVPDVDCTDQIKAVVHRREVLELKNKIKDLESSAKLRQSVHKISQEVKSQSELVHERQIKVKNSSESINVKFSVERVTHKVQLLGETENIKSLEFKIKSLLSKNKDLQKRLDTALDSQNYKDLPSCVNAMANLIDKDDSQAKILVDLMQSVTSQSGRNTWSDESKSLFAVLLNCGGPSAHDIVRKNIGGPTLRTSYTLARPCKQDKVASTVKDIELNHAR